MSKSNPSHSRTSSVASVLMSPRWFLRTQLWVWPLVAALVLVFIGGWLRVKMEGATNSRLPTCSRPSERQQRGAPFVVGHHENGRGKPRGDDRVRELVPV